MRIATYLKELQQIMELAVNVPADSDWTPHRLDIRLLHEDFFGLSFVSKLGQR